MNKIIIIDCGMGNLRSVQKAFEKNGAAAHISRDTAGIADAAGIVLPGVGAFGDCMRQLEKFKLIEPILDYIKSDRPFLGICLGMQILFSESEEFGYQKGLDVFKGRVARFSGKLKVPHMGWNRLNIKKPSPLLAGLPEEAYMYFVHSYYVAPDDKDIIAATTDYGVEFTSMISHNNIFAAQFHPEKSQALGLGILKRFADAVGA